MVQGVAGDEGKHYEGCGFSPCAVQGENHPAFRFSAHHYWVGGGLVGVASVMVGLASGMTTLMESKMVVSNSVIASVFCFCCLTFALVGQRGLIEEWREF